MASSPDYQGSFITPSGHEVVVQWQNNGRERYLVDGIEVFSGRNWRCKGTREFQAGPHQVLIKFSILRLVCSAYVDGKLLKKDVFDGFTKERRKNHVIKHAPFAPKEKLIGNVVVFLAVLILLTWVISLLQ